LPLQNERKETKVTVPPSPEALLVRSLQNVPPRRLLVASDFDGTLSEIVPESGAARPLPEALDALHSLLSAVGAVAIVSGRSGRDLQRLLPLDGLIHLGDYGLEEPTAEELDALHRFNEAASALVRARHGVQLETKPGSSSVHFRERPEAGDELFDLLRPVAEQAGLAASKGRMVVEVRPQRADKANALRRLIGELDPGGVVYAGDDEGDRMVFELLQTLRLPHVAIGVRSPETRPDLFDACDAVVDGPREAARVFSRLARWADERGRAGLGSAG
jgi:trehalose 6-phosphate phosphatase